MKTPIRRGSALVIVLALLAAVFVLGGLLALMAVSAYNTANAFDNKLKYEHENNKNVLAQYNQKVMEVAQVPEMMRDDLVKVATAALQGRYGAEGSKAVFQMITEQNPNVDPAVYVKVQQVVEAGRDEFKVSQTRLLDIKNTYGTALGAFPQGFLMRMFGYPKVPLEQYNIVTTEGVERAFQAGKEAAPIKLRPAP